MRVLACEAVEQVDDAAIKHGSQLSFAALSSDEIMPGTNLS